MSKYEFGWNDPRGVNMLGKIDLNGLRPTGLEDAPTEVLRDLWMVQFGSRAVTHDVMYDARVKDETHVAQELVNRKLITQQKLSRMDMNETLYYYVLEKENADR
jgi:hypothetical protein